MKIKVIAAAFSFLCAAGMSQAQNVRILVGYPPGGGVDALARLFAPPLSEALNRTVVVENRAGASGQLAPQALKAAAPDGNTLLLAPSAVMVVAPHTYSKLPYSPLEDFVSVAHTGTFEYGLIVAANSPVKNLKDWTAAVKATPTAGAYGTPGLGTGPHFVGMMLAQEAGLKLESVSYKGVAPATTDLIGGQVPSVILPYGQLDPFIKAGRVRVLAHTGDARSSSLPDVPTFKELGYPSLEIVDWYGLFAPAGTSPEIVQRYNAAINQALRSPEVRAKMAALGLGVREMRPDAMAAMVRSDFARWRTVVKASGYSADTK
jgi:tripartite-type tricarboxylate transporter receptor subunit TctC